MICCSLTACTGSGSVRGGTADGCGSTEPGTTPGDGATWLSAGIEPRLIVTISAGSRSTLTLANRDLRDELAHGLEWCQPLEDGHYFQGRITTPVEAHRAHQAPIILRPANLSQHPTAARAGPARRIARPDHR